MTNLDFISYLLVPILGDFFLIYIFFDFMKRVERTIYKPKYYYIVAYFIFSILAILISRLGSMPLTLITVLVGSLTVGYFLYNNSKAYLIYYLVFTISVIICDILASHLITTVVTFGGVYFKSNQFFTVFLVISVRFIQYIFAKIFTLAANRKRAEKITSLQWFSFLIIPIFSVIYIFTLIMYLQLYAGVFELLLFIINLVLILGLNIYTTYIFDTVSKNNVLQGEIKLFKQQTKLQYDYYDNLERKYNESRKIIHDIRNHLQTVEHLYSVNEIEEGKKYTENIHKMLNELNQKYYTSNRVLNIILNDKFQKLKNTHVVVEHKIGDIDLDFIRNIDITTIFSNLLDNAIDAAIEVKEDSFVKVHIDKFNDFIVINVINSTISKPIKKGSKFKSTKDNHQGLGIENVKKTLEQYEASMVIDYTKEDFKVNIVIPT